MKMLRACAVMLLVSSSIAGCVGKFREGVPHYTGTKPTAQSVDPVGQLYKGSLFVATDFKADGSARQLVDYNYSTESAPCTVIDPDRLQADENGAYRLDRDGHEFIFICRAEHRDSPSERRLFLAGTHKECLTHTDSYAPRPAEILEGARELCKGVTQSSSASKVETDFDAIIKGQAPLTTKP